MITRHQPLGIRLLLYLIEQALNDICRQYTIAILGERGVIPHPIIDSQTDKPAKQ